MCYGGFRIQNKSRTLVICHTKCLQSMTLNPGHTFSEIPDEGDDVGEC